MQVSKTTWILALVLLAISGAYFVIGSESYFPPHPYIDTIFAPDFTWEGYEKVETGMTRTEAKKIIGERLGDGGFIKGGMRPNELYRKYRYCDAYSDDKHVWGAWVQVNVCYDGSSDDAKVGLKYQIWVYN